MHNIRIVGLWLIISIFGFSWVVSGKEAVDDICIPMGAFLLEAATMVNKGKDARDGIEYMLSFQQPNGKYR